MFIDNFQVGNVVECAGIIGTFDENTQIVLIDEPSSIIGFSSVPDPEVLGIDVFSTSDGGGGQIQETVTGEAYEGVYVQFNNVFVVDVAPFGDFRWTWYLQDADGNKIQIRDASGFYRNDTNTDDECSIWVVVQPAKQLPLMNLHPYYRNLPRICSGSSWKLTAVQPTRWLRSLPAM